MSSLPEPPAVEFWPPELQETVERLGPPTGVYTTATGLVRKRTRLGFGFLTISGIAHLIYWLTPVGANLPAKLAPGILFLLPTAGLLELVLAWRARGVWVLAYPMGLFHWRRGHVTAFPWEEIQGLRFSGVKQFGTAIIDRDSDGRIVEAWLPVWSTGFRGWTLWLLRDDGCTAAVSRYVGGAKALRVHLQCRTFRAIWPNVLESLRSGLGYTFGPLSVSKDGLTDDRGELVRWEQIGRVRTDRTLQIRKVGRWYPWRTIPLDRIPNLHVLLTLLQIWREVINAPPQSP